MTQITSHVDDNDALQYLTVKHEGGPANGRSLKVEIGKEYGVQPPNPQKLKHRGRRCTVLDWVLDDIGSVMGVAVRFIDNNRRGRVDIGDLVKVNAVGVVGR